MDEHNNCSSAVDTDEEPNDQVVESVKNLFYNTLENDFQCPICNELIVKVHRRRFRITGKRVLSFFLFSQGLYRQLRSRFL